MNNFKKTLILSFILIGILAFPLHQAYEWSGQNYYVGFMVPVSESTWEHMKLFFFPMLCFSLLTWLKYYKHSPFHLSILLYSCLLGTWLIPVLFYSYRGILGHGISLIDISTFYVSLLFSFIFLWKQIVLRQNKKNQPKVIFKLILIITILQTILFIYFTYHPLKFGIFMVEK